MLSTIKSIIQKKENFLEAAQMLFEDGSETALDDSIILGEETEDEEPIDDEETEEPEEDGTEDNGYDGEENEGGEDSDIDPLDQPVSDEEEPTAGSDDILDQPVDGGEQPLPLPGDNLPTPVGAQTGEPITGDIDDILDTQIDLKSNTVNDVLPIPPSNAADAIEDDDIMSQDVDENPLNSASDTSGMEPGDIFSEGISLDGETGEAPEGTDAGTGDGETPPDEGIDVSSGEENDVTSAVRDKVAEADDTSDISADDGGGDASKEALMKKLSSITKSLEDAKNAVMSAIQ